MNNERTGLLQRRIETKDVKAGLIMTSGIICNCGVKINPMHNYCNNCGEKLRNVCKHCKTVDVLDAKFCNNCGEKF